MTTKQLERRIVDASPEIRSNADGTVGVRGYFAVWDSVAHGEVIRRGAFDRTIAQRDDIRLLVNHDGTPLARTKSGTLVLGTDDHGAWFDAASLDVENNPTARELVSALSRGDIDQCSFAGYFSDRKGPDGTREVFEVKGLDVSVVTYPWYEETSASLTTPAGRSESLLVSKRTAPAGAMSWSDVASIVRKAIRATTNEWCYIVDIGDTWVVYATESSDALFLADYTIADGVATLGEAITVEPTYVPTTDPAAAAAVREDVPSLTIAEARALLASAAA